jgi:WD40 repeat protein
VLISSSKDTLIKVWDVDSQKSIQVISDFSEIIHQIEIIENWLLVDQPSKILIYKFNIAKDPKNDKIYTYCSREGEIVKKSTSYALCIKHVPQEKLLMILNSDSSLEIYKEATAKDVLRKLLRPKKRKLLALKNKAHENDNNEKITKLEEDILKYKEKVIKAIGSGNLDKGHFFININVTKFSNAKPISFDTKFSSLFNGVISVALINNSIEQYKIEIKGANLMQVVEDLSKCISSKTFSVEYLYTIDSWVHKTAIRHSAICDDDSLFASACNTQIKLWSIDGLKCVKSIQSTDVTSMCFLPSGKFIAAGQKNGDIALYETNTGNEIWKDKVYT